MKVCVSPDLCCGAQQCAAVAPDFYKLRDDGFSALVGVEDYEVPAGLEESAVKGARACPEGAIHIIDDK